MSSREQRLSVTVSLGATLPVTEFGNVKPQITIEHIDLGPDAESVEVQVDRALSASAKAFLEIDGQLETVLSQLIAPVTGKPGYRDRLEQAEKSLELAKKNLKTVAEEVRRHKVELAKLIGEKVSEDGGEETAATSEA